MENKAANNRSLIFIFITILLDMTGVGLIVPIIPELLETLTGKGLSDAAMVGGLLIFAYAGVQFLFAPVLGELSDRYGRKPILLMSLAGLGLDYFIHAFSPTIGWLFLGRIVAGLFGASHTVATAYVADISTKENKAKNFGIIGAAFGLGFVIGPVIGGVIGEYWGIRAPFIVAGCFSILNFLFGVFVLKESLPMERRRAIDFKKMLPFVSLSHLGKYKSVIGLILAFVLVNLAGQVMYSTWSFFTMEKFLWSKSEVGISLMVVGLLVSIVQAVLTGALVKKYGNRKVILGGFICWNIGMLAIGFASSTFYLYVAIIPYIVGGIAGPTIQGFVSNKVSDKEQGNLQGVLTSLVSLTAIVGPVLYTSLFSFYTGEQAPIYFPGAPYIAAGLILIVATVVAVMSLNKVLARGNEEIIDDQPAVEEI